MHRNKRIKYFQLYVGQTRIIPSNNLNSIDAGEIQSGKILV